MRSGAQVLYKVVKDHEATAPKLSLWLGQAIPEGLTPQKAEGRSHIASPPFRTVCPDFTGSGSVTFAC